MGIALAVACLPDLSVAQPPGDPCGSGYVDLAHGEACDPGDAGAVGCTSTCQIDCDGGAIDPTSNHCYFWVDNNLSIDDGIAQCGYANAHLVHFVDLPELQFVVTNGKSLPGAPDSGATWLALEKTAALDDAGYDTYLVPGGISLPGWSAYCAGCFALADGGDAGLPLGGTQPQDCVNWRRSTNASFTQGVCTLTTPGPVLCEREPAGAFSTLCAPDAGNDLCIAVPHTVAHKTYVLPASAQNFANAIADCAARGGMLAHFESSAEREEVVGEIARVVGTEEIFDLWIGLAWGDDAGAWTWLDGTPATAVPLWADQQPAASSGAAAIHFEPQRYDTRLAIAEDPTNINRYVCQITK